MQIYNNDYITIACYDIHLQHPSDVAASFVDPVIFEWITFLCMLYLVSVINIISFS